MVKKGGGLQARRASGRPTRGPARSWGRAPRAAPTRTRSAPAAPPTPSPSTSRAAIRRSRAACPRGSRPERNTAVQAEPAAAAAVPRRLQGRPRRLPGDRVADPGDLPEPDLRVADEPVDRRSHGGERRPGRLLLLAPQRLRLHAEGQADQRVERLPSARSLLSRLTATPGG